MPNLTTTNIINKSLFFLGAGFSRRAGCKTSVDMFADLKKRIFDQQDMTFSKTQKEALKFLISCLQYHAEWRTMESSNDITFAPNIEELALLIRRIKNRENFLPYPITGNWADKLVTLESEYSKETKNNTDFQEEMLFESLERVLKSLLKNEWFKIDSDLSYLKPLLEFIQNTSKSDYRFEIFTLNNDVVIEQYFSKHEEIPWRGFVNGKWQDISNDTQNDPYGRIDLYKLHGSIDWVRLEDMDVWEEEKLGDEDKENIQHKHNPYIIFGQGTKTFSVEPFFSLINHFNNQLNSDSKDYFFVVGYSFFDPYVNNLLFNAVKGFKKLIIVNPHFGPERIYGRDKKLEGDPEDFYRVKYPPDTNQSDLTDYMREIQKNSFFSELPEFNYLTISAENIEYIPLPTEKFVQKFFGNGGKLLLDFIKIFEKEKEKG
ncbi:SIR2 family protein, partial [bacterium]|nr:SIR2 family protein [bacterium]